LLGSSFALGENSPLIPVLFWGKSTLECLELELFSPSRFIDLGSIT